MCGALCDLHTAFCESNALARATLGVVSTHLGTIEFGGSISGASVALTRALFAHAMRRHKQ